MGFWRCFLVVLLELILLFPVFPKEKAFEKEVQIDFENHKIPN